MNIKALLAIRYADEQCMQLEIHNRQYMVTDYCHCTEYFDFFPLFFFQKRKREKKSASDIFICLAPLMRCLQYYDSTSIWRPFDCLSMVIKLSHSDVTCKPHSRWPVYIFRSQCSSPHTGRLTVVTSSSNGRSTIASCSQMGVER